MDTRLIFLTHAPALIINHSEWPVLVVSLDFSTLGEFALRVREHRDGRLLVYATHGSHITGEHYSAAGELLDADADAAEAIRRVGLACRVPGSLVGTAIRQLGQLLSAA